MPDETAKVASGTILKILDDVIRHQCVHVMGLSWVGDAVALGWVDHHVELFAEFLQFVDVLRGVLHVDVVVDKAVDEEEFT